MLNWFEWQLFFSMAVLQSAFCHSSACMMINRLYCCHLFLIAVIMHLQDVLGRRHLYRAVLRVLSECKSFSFPGLI